MIEKRQKVDSSYLILIIVMLGIGIIVQYSASSFLAAAKYNNPNVYLFAHLKRMIIGALIGVGFMFFNYQWLKKIAFWLTILSMMFLVAVIVYYKVKGIQDAARWLSIGPFRFQPSEFTKLALIIYIASFIDRHQKELHDFKQGFLPVTSILGVSLLLIVIEPNYSTAAVVGSLCLILMVIGGTRLLFLTPLLAASVVASVYIIIHSPYKLQRIFTFLNPEQDLQHAGYQLHQSLISLGNGGFFGRGLGSGIEKNLFLPEPHTDFVFAVVGEELGFIGTLVILILFLVMFFQGLRIAVKAPDVFGNLLGIGLSMSMFFYVLANIGVVCGVFPVTGLPLPFLSYGGSTLIFNFICIGILLNISRQALPPKKPTNLVILNG